MASTTKDSKIKNIDQIISTIGELPASPAIVTAIMNLTSNLNSEVSELGKHILSDQVLTAKVLKLSNSSFYGRSKKVSSINDAVIILGFHTIRSLVLASSVRGLFKKKDSSKFEGILWEHSLSTAIVCRLLAEHFNHPLRDEAFVCGILHDIGKLIIYRKFGESYDDLVKEQVRTKKPPTELEEEYFGFDHTQVGAALLEKWNFPDEFVSAIRDHHDWVEYDKQDNMPISWIVNYASLCSTIIGCNMGATENTEVEWLEAVEKIGIPFEEANVLNAQLFELFTEEKKIYE
ncbi:MAG: HDOD domain-containing protein [candidate division Zixibacteria bacterium]|nr:HDOD domain-containing protein [candidate division Zixibacteria bacterium]